jgi:type II secretory pathway component PulC
MEDGSGLGGSHAVPYEVDGRTTGFRLTRAGGMLGRLGLRPGDVLVAANGAPLTSADAALGAFGRLRHADNLRLTVLRNGSPVTLRYRVVD